MTEAGTVVVSDDNQALVGSWIAIVENELDPGGVADLRRLDPDRPSSPTFWRLVAPIDHAGDRQENERRWAVVLRTLAQLRGLHHPGAYVGRKLAQSEIHERRLLRLLRARGESLAHELRTIGHLLAAKSVRLDVAGLAMLVFSDGKSWGEDVRRCVARDFYRAKTMKTRAKAGEKA